MRQMWHFPFSAMPIHVVTNVSEGEAKLPNSDWKPKPCAVSVRITTKCEVQYYTVVS